MKDPDTLGDAIDDAIKSDLANLTDEDEKEAVKEVRAEKVRKLCAKWFDYGEYLMVEIDTERETCTVVSARS